MNTKVKNIVVSCAMILFILGFSIYAWLKPADDESLTERKKLAQFPDVTWEKIVDKSFMKDFESYTLDQFPLRDSFAQIKSGVNLYILQMKNNLRGSNNYYVHNGYVSEMEYPLNESSMDYVGNRFQNIYNLYLKNKDVNTYFSIIPDKNYFIAGESGQLMLDYENVVQTMKDKTSYMEYIDIFDLLTIEDYYKTDTHWKQESIIDVAKLLGEKMGATITGEGYTPNVLENFTGVYYGQSGIPGLKKEELTYLTSDILDACKVYTINNAGMKVPAKGIYDMDKAKGNDLYETYLSGSVGYIEIQNPNATTDKELVVFRDSFGSSLAPLLVEGYAKITILDIRYMNSMLIPRYVSFNNQDVLFIYSTIVMNNGTTLT